jgi:hypothetical protein
MWNPFSKPKRLVILHHQSMDESFEGVWVGTFNDHYELEAASLIGQNNQRRSLAGNILVPAAKVAFLQVVDTDKSR